MITRAFPEPRERARAIGTWAAISGLSLPAGLLVGGLLVDTLGWRSIFLVNLPIVAGALVVTDRVVRESRSPGRSLDVAGVVLAAATLAALTYAFVQSSLAAGALAVLIGLVFVVVEHRQREPMLPLALFRRGGFSGANAIAGAMNLGSLGNVFVLTLYLQGVRGLSPLEAGLAATPAFSMLSIVAPFGGRLAARFGARACVIAGLVTSAAGLALLTTADAHTPYLTLLPGFLLWGAGLGVLTPAVVAAAMGSVPDDRAGLASGVNNTARQAGGAIGIAAFGAIAGSPSSSDFVHGFHVTLLCAAALYLAAAALGAITLRATSVGPGTSPRRSDPSPPGSRTARTSGTAR